MIFLPRNIQPILFIFILFLRIDKKSNNEAYFLDFFFLIFFCLSWGVMCNEICKNVCGLWAHSTIGGLLTILLRKGHTPNKMLVCFHWAHSTLNGPFKIWLVFVIFDSNCPSSLAHTENLVAFVISAEYELVESKNYAMHGNPIIFKDNRDQKIQCETFNGFAQWK